MARSANQKAKLLYLAKIFSEETDEAHGLSINDLEERLSAYDIEAERKSLYSDIEALKAFGMDIICVHEGRKYLYYLGERPFELTELKLLVDLVESSKFITEKKSRTLIKKLESLTSRHEAAQLNRQVLIGGRVKSMNESIYYNVDKIQGAMAQNKKIRFKYFQWNVEKKQELRRNGDWYYASPWHLLWDNEKYYLISYDADAGEIRHFRVDKMKNISPLNEERSGKKEMEDFDPASYTKQVFGMYGGEPVSVTLEASADMAGVIIDRFGTDIPITKIDEDHFRCRVDVAVSNQFLGWIAGLGGKVKITGPGEVIEEMRELLKTLSEQYQIPAQAEK